MILRQTIQLTMKSTDTSSRKQKPTPSRKKSCLQCAKSKVRCGLERPACARCVAAKRECRYAVSPEGPPSNVGSRQSVPPVQSVATPESLANSLTDHTDIALVATTLGSQSTPLPPTTQLRASGNHTDASLDFSNLDLVPLANAEQIRVRWLRPFLAVGEQVPKIFHPYTLQFINCVLRTYPKQMIEENGFPPIIHPIQMADGCTPVALANCYSLIRLWQHRAPGSEGIVAETIQREMNRLAHCDSNAGDLDNLAAFQAYLIYSIGTYFFPIQGNPLVDDATMFTLQEMAFRTAQSGLVSQAEFDQSRPKWESWIVVSAKRRAIFAFYLLSNVYNADNYVPNFLAEELKEVYAPDAKRLWEARTRIDWEREYSQYLSQWEDGQLKISELWRSPDTGSAERRGRIDRWVQSADEFGMMLFAVCAHLHGY
ncbi:hypothetical protein C368_03525 [Cryptococcus neoformans 125.91]|nr:hypothetical protein C353_03472 [Cryptococcus neoformans var. grubii AD1-83a]OWZ54382.1 hypothetical protein C368_03525 [Cryptococcus neoformans var. grubii 125.91]OXG58943.1 hypothetical protein C354_03409 [Cryptococcus neoformans var. grubii MW-RSA1955]OXG63521.1 hypothetical protein C351_03197 [Cryptococcus neoformans var. grubii c8]OXG63916.1 hypothetical protein C352_03419 [Cryptococcus neoformans var. grubii CHC193]OXH10234.1 hypothetical protein C369_03447 [Cryptococcus neoformans va